MLDNTPDQRSKFRTKDWVVINEDSWGKYNTNSETECKTTMLKSRLCDYSDAYVLVKGWITTTGARTDSAARQGDERNERVILKLCALFTDCMSKINNNAKGLDVVMLMHNLIEYIDNYSSWNVLKVYGNVTRFQDWW